MVYTATLTKTGQITVPKPVRDFLGLTPGKKIVFKPDIDSYRLECEKTATEIAQKIDQLIPDDVRENYMKNYAGLSSTEMQEKWLESKEATEYFEAERKRTQ